MIANINLHFFKFRVLIECLVTCTEIIDLILTPTPYLFYLN